jgi:hypothetical protein
MTHYRHPKIKYNIRHLKKGSFNCKLAFEFLTANLIKKCDSQLLIKKLHNKAFSVKDFLKTVNLFLRANVDTKYYSHPLSDKESESAKRLYCNEDIQKILRNESKLTNDWQMLYMIHQINSKNTPDWIKHDMIKYMEAHDKYIYLRFKDDTDNRNRNAFNAITKRLKDMSEYVSPKEIELLKKVIKDIFSLLDKGETLPKVTYKSLKKKTTDYLIFLLTDGNGNHVSTLKKNREYNAMVMMPKIFRKITPLIYLQIDLTSATPQLIDRILGTNVGLYVYSNLMKSKNISRDKAKDLFNSTVNNGELKIRTTKKIYLACGYGSEQATRLAKMTAQVKKGSFYQLITAHEKKVIENYQRVLSPRSHRFHDGLVVSKESIDDSHITIPTCMDGFIYHVDVFNNGSTYAGPTTHEPRSSKHMIDNYITLLKNVS